MAIMMKIKICLCLAFIVSFSAAQHRFFLHVTLDGKQEAMPMRDGEQLSDAMQRFGRIGSGETLSQIVDTMKNFIKDSDLSYEFGNLEEEMMMQWYQVPGDGFVREVCWAISGDVGESKEVNIRLWYLNPRLLDIPNSQHVKNLGYYVKSDDPVNQVTPYRELATDTTWIFPPKSSDSLHYAFDPLGVEASWKKGGMSVPVKAYSWHSLDLLTTGDTMKFKENQLIGFTVLNNATSTAGIRQEVASFPNPEYPFHSYKFYPRGRLSSNDRGWWLRGDFEWGMFMVVEYTSAPRPKVTISKLLNSAVTQERRLTATVKTGSVNDPVDVQLFTKLGNGAWQSSPMVREDGFVFTGTLPAADPGDSVFYYINASDTLGRMTKSPVYEYVIFKKKNPLLLLFNGKTLPSGTTDPSIYLKYTMKTDFGAPPYYDFCDARQYTITDLSALFELYNVIIEVAGESGTYDLTKYSGAWLENSSSLPAGVKRYYIIADQDHGIISNKQDTIFADTDMHVKYFGVKGIVQQDFPYKQNSFAEVKFPWQLNVSSTIIDDAVFGFLPENLTKDTVTLWYHPYYEIPLFTNRMDKLQPATNGVVLFSDALSNAPVGVKAVDPNGRWQSYFLAFDWMALDLRSDTASVKYEYPFLDPKYRWIVDIQNIGKTFAGFGVPTGVREAPGFPAEFALRQNYPNPFNPSTTFEFQLPVAEFATLTVYDILGKEVKTLLNQILEPGTHTIRWNAGNLPSGIYFYRLSAGNRTDTKKLLLLK